MIFLFFILFIIVFIIVFVACIRFWLDVRQSKPLQDYYNDLIDKIDSKDIKKDEVSKK